MLRTTLATGLFALAVPLLVPVACADARPACYAGEYVGCACGAEQQGYAMCRADQTGYDACVCDGSIPGLDAGKDVSTPEASAGPKPNFEACTTDTECVGGRCFAYGDGRTLCTNTCTVPADCAPPSTACTGQGVCKVP